MGYYVLFMSKKVFLAYRIVVIHSLINMGYSFMHLPVFSVFFRL